MDIILFLLMSVVFIYCGLNVSPLFHIGSAIYVWQLFWSLWDTIKEQTMSDYSRNNNDIKLQIEHDNHIAILSDDQDWVIDYVIEIKEKEFQQLKQQLEEKEKEIKYHKAWAVDFQQQLKEAVEVIEFYGDENEYKVVETKYDDYPTILGDNDFINGVYCGGKRARQFLAKYKEKRNENNN